MTVAYENQFDLKHYTKADSNDIELALIGHRNNGRNTTNGKAAECAFFTGCR